MINKDQKITQFEVLVKYAILQFEGIGRQSEASELINGLYNLKYDMPISPKIQAQIAIYESK